MESETMVDQEFVGFAEGSPFWYEDDLQLAAELGKTLLERNKDLEAQLRTANQLQNEHAREIELLSKQVEVLRNVNVSRMRTYEEMDKSQQELEQSNARLHQESTADKTTVKTLSETVDRLESRCEELETALEQMKRDEKQRLKREHNRRTLSVPSLNIVSDKMSQYEFRGIPTQEDVTRKRMEDKTLRDLRSTASKLKLQLKGEQRKREELESDVSQLEQDITLWEAKYKTLEFDRERQQGLERDMENFERNLEKLCEDCKQIIFEKEKTEDKSDELFYEHDLNELPRGELVRLKNGGSAYGSRESLNTLGLEAEDECLAFQLQRIDFEKAVGLRSPDDEEPRRRLSSGAEGAGLSILGELEEQYRILVKKYENLVEAKIKRVEEMSAKDMSAQDNLEVEPKRPLSLGAVPQYAEQVVMRRKNKNVALDLKSPIDPTDSHFENGPPEYQKLFKEIFQTLRRSVVLDDSDTGLEDGGATADE